MSGRTSSSPAGGGSHPLRPYYTPSDDDAAFVATAPRYGGAGAATASAASGGQGGTSSSSSTGRAGSTSYVQPGLAASNRYAAASTFDDADDKLMGIGSGGASDMARALLVGAAFQYTSTCLAMPFEVGKLLLQIQWVPRDDVWVAFGEKEREEEMARLGLRHSGSSRLQHQRRSRASHGGGGGVASSSGKQPIGRNEWAEGDASRSDDSFASEEDDNDDLESPLSGADDPSPGEWTEGQDSAGHRAGRDFGGEDDELSDEDDAEAYFRDLSSTSARDGATAAAMRQRRKKTDSSGYVMRKSIHEDGTRPDFVMPVVVRGGVWEMIKAVGRGKEGWLGLWKGSFTTFVMDTTAQTVQPIVTFVLSFFAPTAMTPLPLPYAPHPYRSLGLLLTSHLVTGILVSPLDLVRTRLIAQSTLPPHRKYSSPWKALQQIVTEEGGWRTVYFHPNLFIPTLLDFTLRPLLSLGAPLLIEYNLRLDPTTSPVRYSLAEFCISTASLLITLPIETVRRRLQLQARAGWGQATSMVHGSRPRPRGRSSFPAVDKASGNSSGRASKDKSAASDQASFFASVTGAIPKPIHGKHLRTCVETRPVPYEGVCEAFYRIITEETSTTPVKKSTTRAAGSDSKEGQEDATASPESRAAAAMMESGILAKQGHSSFGGLYSLYRGLGFAIGANALVFVLTIVTGERAHANAGWAEI